MIRRLNYTGRRRIERRDAQIRVVYDSSLLPCVEATLSLSGYDLPSNGRVFIEAYRQTTRLRFGWGTVGDLVAPESTSLGEFNSPEGVRFRVKVVGVDASAGRMLAVADGLVPSADDKPAQSRKSLLPVLSEPLSGEAWTIRFSPHPHLAIDSRFGDPRAFVRSPEFGALVLPAVLRAILREILQDGGAETSDDLEAWQTDWLLFALSLPGVAPLSGDADRIVAFEWVDDVVAAFCKRHRLVDGLLSASDMKGSQDA